MSKLLKKISRTLILGILFVFVIVLYIFLPKVLKHFINISHDDLELIKHFVLTIIAVLGVHLIDLFVLKKDTERSLQILTNDITSKLINHIDKILERHKKEVDDEYQSAKRHFDDLAQFFETSTNQTQIGVRDLSQTLESLNNRVKGLEGLLLKIDYLKVGDDGVTEATIFQRAIAEISKATESIDVFTSYLLEVDDDIEINLKTKDEYFELLLNLCRNNQIKEYRRIVQVREEGFMEDFFSDSAPTYLNHIKLMAQLEQNNKKVHPRIIFQRRPTTYVIIDKKVLLWQINQIVKDEQMQMYAMFIVEDSANILIRHFINEFEDYYHGALTEHPKFKSNT